MATLMHFAGRPCSDSVQLVTNLNTLSGGVAHLAVLPLVQIRWFRLWTCRAYLRRVQAAKVAGALLPRHTPEINAVSVGRRKCGHIHGARYQQEDV